MQNNRMPASQIERRLHSLETHLQQENPVLLEVVKSFRELDSVARSMGFMHHEESYASHVPWWPIVTVLGTYSSGKSTFINDHLGYRLQLTGNQAVDDKFTVISFSAEDTVRVLPGLALDADLRFPFYKISREIESVATGEGRRIDAYLQLKTCPSRQVRGMILIDSPGFDADEQRTAVLRITKHIIGLSDLVLVFFDARHPEMGTMQDTLRHLVEETIHRNDSNKFIYVLNQIDTTAREDNAEDVVASWQRALASKGLTAGRFYRTYSRTSSIPIENPNVRARYEAKRDMELAEIDRRIHQVSVERSYRIVGALERTVIEMEDTVVPRLRVMIKRWRNTVLTVEAVLTLAVVAAALTMGITLEQVDPIVEYLTANSSLLWIAVGALVLGVGWIHFRVRRLAALWVTTRTRRALHKEELVENYLAAFARNTRFFRSIFLSEPAGWNARARAKLNQVTVNAGGYVQKLNDAFTNPSGNGDPESTSAAAPAAAEASAEV
ncbi:Dynamin family protein [Gammaproteobacteria bacterium]